MGDRIEMSTPHTTVVGWVSSDDEGIKSGIVNTFDETVVDDLFDGSVAFRMFDGSDRIAAAQQWIDHRNKPYEPDETFEDSASTCVHCQRPIVLCEGRWVDPNATGDDSVWRETCDAHDTFTAEHEPNQAVEDDVVPIVLPTYSISDILGLPKPPVMTRTVEPEDIFGSLSPTQPNRNED